MQIGPVLLRPDLARSAPRPDSARTTSRPDSGRTQTRITRPARPASRHPNQDVRPISPYTDWYSLADEAEAEVISIHSDNSDNNYVPHSPVYEPDSPGPNPVEKSEDWDPRPDNPVEEMPEGPQSEPSRTVFSNVFTDSQDSNRERDSNTLSARPRTLGRGIPVQRVSPFLRGLGQRRHLGRVRPM